MFTNNNKANINFLKSAFAKYNPFDNNSYFTFMATLLNMQSQAYSALAKQLKEPGEDDNATHLIDVINDIVFQLSYDSKIIAKILDNA